MAPSTRALQDGVAREDAGCGRVRQTYGPQATGDRARVQDAGADALSCVEKETADCVNDQGPEEKREWLGRGRGHHGAGWNAQGQRRG